MLLGVDASNLIHRYWHAQRGPEMPADVDRCVTAMVHGVLDAIRAHSVTHLVLAHDSPGGSHRRRALHPEYKGHRAPSPPGLKATFARAEKTFALLGWPMHRSDGDEADDLLASFAQQHEGPVIIMSADRDLWACVSERVRVLLPDGSLVDPQRCQEKFGVRPEQVADYKALVGDSSDGYAGVPGIGPVAAATILTRHRSLADALAHTDDIPGKPGRILAEHAALAQQMYALALLDDTLSVPSVPAFSLDASVAPAVAAEGLVDLAESITAEAQMQLWR